MTITRRDLLHGAACLSAVTASGLPLNKAVGQGPALRRIAVEEGFLTKEIFGGHLELLARHPELEPGFAHFWQTALGTPGSLAAHLSNIVGGETTAGLIDLISRAADGDSSVAALSRLFDLENTRIQIMDEHNISMQIVSLASPGVQVFDAEVAATLARDANDVLAQAIKNHPTRLAGLAAIAPHSSAEAVKELDRAINKLGLKGVVINSHTKGQYLDEDPFRPILAKIADLGVPLYIHPRTPSPQMLEPFTKYPGLAAATYGFNVETCLHAIRLILSGVFDDFPSLKVVLGHMGEGLLFWIDRIDNRTAFIQTGPGEKLRDLKKRPSDYLRENFYISSSGMNYEPQLRFAREMIGPDRILFATDYPMEDVGHAVEMLDGAQIGDDDRRKIYQTNAERIFGLGT